MCAQWAQVLWRTEAQPPYPRTIQVREQVLGGGMSTVTLGLWSKERSAQTQKSAFGDSVDKNVRTTKNQTGLHQSLAVK